MILIFIIILIYLLICISFINCNQNYIHLKKIGIPKLIWSYWEGREMPKLVQECINSWKKQNPKYKLVVLNDQKVKELFNFDLETIKNKELIPRKADFARLLAIEKYGGIWIDSSILTLKPFESFLPLDENIDFIGYIAPHTTNMDIPIIENWFFAAPKNSQLIKDWLNESFFMNEFNTEQDYINQVQNIIDIQNLKPALPYLVMHVTLAKCIQTRKYNYKLFEALSNNGPFEYLANNDWNPEKAIKSICNGTNQPMIKFRGVERLFMEKNNIQCNILSN